jgi:acid phosphatase (class A)
MARNMRSFRANHMNVWPVALALAALPACSADGDWIPQPQKAAAQDFVPPAASTPAQDPAGQALPADMAAEARAALAASYLKGQAPDSLALLPAPPAAGSAAQARDDAAAKAAQTMRNSPRWRQAAQDANLKFPDAAETFACAAGVEISPETTPTLYRMLQRTMADIGLSTYPTKNKFQRTRPFVATSTATCTPGEESFLRKDGSYPSGHSAIGWGWALIIAEAAPDRADAILERGRAFGQSRVVCNVHWLSDTEEGRVMAAATVARLHGEQEFRSDLEAASREIAAARSVGSKPGRDCQTEAAQLAAR